MSKPRLHLVVPDNGSDCASQGYEDLFIARYEQLLLWAGDMTEGDWDRAEDLVQDAFIQFTLSRPSLGQIENLDGYLRVCLRNLFISQIRRSSVGGRRHWVLNSRTLRWRSTLAFRQAMCNADSEKVLTQSCHQFWYLVNSVKASTRSSLLQDWILW